MMAKDFWQQVLAASALETVRPSTPFFPSPRESARVVATCWQRQYPIFAKACSRYFRSTGSRGHHECVADARIGEVCWPKVESGLYNNASEVVREGLRLLKEHDEIRLKWREQIEHGWHQAQRGELVDGNEVFDRLDSRLKARRTRSK
jgi:antitoxin ParD1/3/4